MAKQKLKLGEEIERLAEEHGLDIELSDGTVVSIPPPELWPEESKDIFGNPQAEDEDLARCLMGDENWALFVADGGTPILFSHFLARRYQLTVGESSASSTS